MTRSTGSAAVARRAMPRSAAEAHTPWHSIRAEYVEGPGTNLRTLARLHRVSLAELRARAAREGWVRARTLRLEAVEKAWRRRDAREFAEARRAAIPAVEELLAAARREGTPLPELLRVSESARRAVGALWTAASRVTRHR